MSQQIEMFPKTELEEAVAVRNRLQADVDRCHKAVDSAHERLSEAVELQAKQERVIIYLTRAVHLAEEAVAAGAAGVHIDPETGEIYGGAG